MPKGLDTIGIDTIPNQLDRYLVISGRVASPPPSVMVTASKEKSVLKEIGLTNSIDFQLMCEQPCQIELSNHPRSRTLGDIQH